MRTEDTVDDVTDPLVRSGLRPRGPSPTPVSHVGASARTVSPRSTRLPITAEPAARTGSRWWIPVAVLGLGLALVAALSVSWAVFGTRLGAWALSPEQGAVSPLEPVEVELQPDASASTSHGSADDSQQGDAEGAAGGE